MQQITKAELGNNRSRVATGDRSPAAPTDPDVPNSGIRLLGLWCRCATVNTVNNTRWGERIVLGQTGKFLPRHPGTPGATTEPLVPQPPNLIEKAGERSRIARDPIVGVVTLELAAQRRLLHRHTPMAVCTAPVANLPQRTGETVLRRLALHYPTPLPGAPPKVGEP